jgi:thioesterase domain-containing protein
MNQPPGYPAVENTWQGMASEGIDIYDVPGGHTTMLAAPNVNILAEKLLHCLERLPLEKVKKMVETLDKSRILL